MTFNHRLQPWDCTLKYTTKYCGTYLFRLQLNFPIAKCNRALTRKFAMEWCEVSIN